MQLSTDQIIDDRYRVLERLGQGGMGEVWKALDQQMNDEVVIKVPLIHSNEMILKRFAAEAHLMRKHSVGNPNILDIQSVGNVDGSPYYVMRFLGGGSLEDRCPLVESGASAEFKAESFEWLFGVCKALDYLHSKSVLHRDVKPANILFNESGDAYLADFGIAKNPTEVTSFTQFSTATGTSPGTFGYMAPEVLDPDPDYPIGGASDQYALAVTLHESIAGRRPYDATNVIKLYRQTQKGCPPLIDSFPSLPGAASAAVTRALSSDFNQRFDSCRQFAEAFMDGLRHRGPAPAVVAPPLQSELETGMVSTGVGVSGDSIRGGTPVAPSTGGSDSNSGGRLFPAPTPEQLRPKKPTGPEGRGNKGLLIGVGAVLLAGLLFGGLFLSGAFNQPTGVSPGSSVAGSSEPSSSPNSTTSQPKGDSPGSSSTPSRVSLSAPFGASEISAALDRLEREEGLKPAITNSLGMKFRLIPAGEFTMGSPESEPDRDDNEKQHRVEISRPFYLSKFEVTQGEWKSVMGTEPWKGKYRVKEGKDYPASHISWEDAVSFCEKLSNRDGVEYRMPSEAEWEYACRGGSERVYSFGDSSDDLGRYAWFEDNADAIGEEYAHEVGLKLGNGFGLHDMHGNVMEWCGPMGPSLGASRVNRGGSWSSIASSCRSAYRRDDSPGLRYPYLGFRVLRSSIK